MAITTVQVTAQLDYPDGSSTEGVQVLAELQSPAQTSDGYIVQKQIKGVVDATGSVTLDLWPNDSGVSQSFYTIQAWDETLGKLLNVVAVVPESLTPLELEDIAMPITGLSLGNASGNVASIRQIDTTEGIIGGGDLSTNRTHKLDLSTLSTQESSPPAEWIVAVQDPASPDSVRWAQLGDLPGVGSDIFETTIATAGQLEVFITESFSPDTGSLDIYINGGHQCPDVYTEEAITLPPFNGKITLTEALEEGDQVCIKIKRSNPFGAGLDASQVTYSGGGSVQDALDLLFSTAEASPWQEVSGTALANAGDRLFVSTNTGSLTITLPASPNVGDSIRIIDVTSSAFTTAGNVLINNFTILRNGSLIMELAEDLIVDQAKVSLEFIYSGVTVGWVVSE